MEQPSRANSLVTVEMTRSRSSGCKLSSHHSNEAASAGVTPSNRSMLSLTMTGVMVWPSSLSV